VRIWDISTGQLRTTFYRARPARRASGLTARAPAGCPVPPRCAGRHRRPPAARPRRGRDPRAIPACRAYNSTFGSQGRGACPGCAPNQSAGLRPAGLAPIGFSRADRRPITEAGGLFLKAGEKITSRRDLPRSARPARPVPADKARTRTTALPTTMTPAQFVDKLNQNAGNVLSASDGATAIALFGSATNAERPYGSA